MNSPQRSAMWAPSTSQSAMVDRPRPGRRTRRPGRDSPKQRAGPQAETRSPSATAPAIQNTPANATPGGDALEIAEVAGAMPSQAPHHEQAAADLHGDVGGGESQSASSRTLAGWTSTGRGPRSISANSMSRTGASADRANWWPTTCRSTPTRPREAGASSARSRERWRRSSSVWESWVTAKTNTRSKNSSTNVTRL